MALPQRASNRHCQEVRAPCRLPGRRGSPGRAPPKGTASFAERTLKDKNAPHAIDCTTEAQRTLPYPGRPGEPRRSHGPQRQGAVSFLTRCAQVLESSCGTLTSGKEHEVTRTRNSVGHTSPPQTHAQRHTRREHGGGHHRVALVSYVAEGHRQGEAACRFPEQILYKRRTAGPGTRARSASEGTAGGQPVHHRASQCPRCSHCHPSGGDVPLPCPPGRAVVEGELYGGQGGPDVLRPQEQHQGSSEKAREGAGCSLATSGKGHAAGTRQTVFGPQAENEISSTEH